MTKRLLSLFIAAAVAVTSLMAFSSALAAENKVKMRFAAWGDPQVSHYLTEREPYLKTSVADLKKFPSVDALVIAGDITENSISEEWDWVYNDIKDCGVKNFITATGNHDIRLNEYKTAKKEFVDFTNNLNKNAGSSLRIDKLHYSYSVNGYKFIVLGSDEILLEEAEISNKQFKWLDSELKKSAKNYKPVFVIIHQPLKNTHGLPETWGSPISSAGSVGAQSDKLKNMLNKYGNVILITGHLHSGFGKYTYQKVGNIYSVNLPSLGVDNENGTYNEHGIGYMVEVTDNEVLFRARNFDKGEYVPKYDININLYSAKAKLSKTSYKYDGKAKKPAVSVTDAYGRKIAKKYYTVKYPKGRKKAGKYKVKITFKGKYKKQKPITKTFKIKK